MEVDFQGWATKPDLRCSDGRTIAHDAFVKQNGMQVPLVWQHNHNDPENVLGHVKLEARDGGLYAHGFLNDTPKAQHARALLEHKDINQLSIWANELIERTGTVLHGKVKEVSLVLAGANPGAVIEHVILQHSDGEEYELEDQVIIKTGTDSGLELVHAGEGNEDGSEEEVSLTLEEVLENDERTIEEIFDGMDVVEQAATSYLVSQALASKGDLKQSDDGASGSDDDSDDGSDESGEPDGSEESTDSDGATDSDDSDDTNDDHAQHDNLGTAGEEGDNTMSGESRNLFDRTEDKKPKAVLAHGDIKGIFDDAKKNGSLMDAMQSYVSEEGLAHGITNVEALFPDAEALNGGVPEWVKRDDGWVQPFLGACTKSPFGRIKTRSADITFEAARAKGYVKGELKKEEFFDIKDRTTTPATIYKKQALDRDDIIDITDFDVVAWMRNEMRMMLDEEIARAILVGDGRAVDHPDKIKTQHIRPIATDDDLYATQVNVNISDASSSFQEFIDACHRNRRFYRGTGNPNFYTTELWIARAMTLKDGVGRRQYRNLEELASELRVNQIIPVEVLEEYPDIIGIMVNPVDYTIGAVRGGQVTMYDDFDIDYNKEKYLIETRLCGALTKLKAALVFNSVAANLLKVAPVSPNFEDDEITINDTTGVVYKNSAGTTVTNVGSPYTVDAGESETIFATPASGYFFEENRTDRWTFTAE